MTFSGLAKRRYDSQQRSTRNGTKIDMVILHHGATTNAEAIIAMEVSGSRTVSSNYVISNTGEVIGVVPEEYRAWTSGSSTDGGKGAGYDRRAITAEVADEKYGDPWPISAKSNEAIIKLLVDVHKRYGVKLDRDHVVGHRELWSRYKASYPTACPGGMDLDMLVREAAKRAGTASSITPAGSGATVIGSGGYKEALGVAEYQRLLIAKGYSVGKTGADGKKGPATTAAILTFQRAADIEADGLVGPATVKALKAATTKAPTKNLIAVDGQWGVATTSALQRRLGVSADGKLGPITYRALQKLLGIPADGIVGPQTRKALQKRLGVTQDGIWGSGTTAALQRRLNTGTL